LAVERPVEDDVDRDATLSLVLESPVDSELTPLALALMPVDAETERDVMSPFVVDRPVESDATPLEAVLATA